MFNFLKRSPKIISSQATPKDSLYPSSLLAIEILVKKYPPTTFLIGYPNIINNEYSSQASKDEKLKLFNYPKRSS